MRGIGLTIRARHWLWVNLAPCIPPTLWPRGKRKVFPQHQWRQRRVRSFLMALTVCLATSPLCNMSYHFSSAPTRLWRGEWSRKLFFEPFRWKALSSWVPERVKEIKEGHVLRLVEQWLLYFENSDLFLLSSSLHSDCYGVYPLHFLAVKLRNGKELTRFRSYWIFRFGCSTP